MLEAVGADAAVSLVDAGKLTTKSIKHMITLLVERVREPLMTCMTEILGELVSSGLVRRISSSPSHGDRYVKLAQSQPMASSAPAPAPAPSDDLFEREESKDDGVEAAVGEYFAETEAPEEPVAAPVAAAGPADESDSSDEYSLDSQLPLAVLLLKSKGAGA